MDSDSRPRVFATRSLPGGALEALTGELELEVWPGPGAPAPEVLARAVAGAAGLLCLLTDRVDAPLLASCPELRVVSSCSVGVDHVDLAVATRRGIPVGHTPGVLTETTADLAFSLLMAAARRIPEADRFVREGHWTPARSWEPDLMLGRDVYGSTLGVIGLGAIGRAVARRAQGFGMRVLGWNRTPGKAPPGVEQVPLDALLRQSAFVSVHVARTDETIGLLGPRELAFLPSGAVLVNTARGGIVDEVALVEALRSGRLAGAGLDVYEQEPLPPDSPLLAAPGLVLAPHIGSASVATRTRMAELSIANLRAGLAGERLPHCANPEVYDAHSEEGQRARKSRGETTRAPR
ncbi:MAG: D-glycerate dehydrogenase [Deltaproteobacteria bacterium]|nr:D-glycerate dehydrogenase [Deltaproteobacteria bacterium]